MAGFSRKGLISKSKKLSFWGDRLNSYSSQCNLAGKFERKREFHDRCDVRAFLQLILCIGGLKCSRSWENSSNGAL
jgi:hypothetical protein